MIDFLFFFLPLELACSAMPLFFAACSWSSAKFWFILTLLNWSWLASILPRTFSAVKCLNPFSALIKLGKVTSLSIYTVKNLSTMSRSPYLSPPSDLIWLVNFFILLYIFLTLSSFFIEKRLSSSSNVLILDSRTFLEHWWLTWRVSQASLAVGASSILSNYSVLTDAWRMFKAWKFRCKTYDWTGVGVSSSSGISHPTSTTFQRSLWIAFKYPNIFVFHWL